MASLEISSVEEVLTDCVPNGVDTVDNCCEQLDLADTIVGRQLLAHVHSNKVDETDLSGVVTNHTENGILKNIQLHDFADSTDTDSCSENVSSEGTPTLAEDVSHEISHIGAEKETVYEDDLTVTCEVSTSESVCPAPESRNSSGNAPTDSEVVTSSENVSAILEQPASSDHVSPPPEVETNSDCEATPQEQMSVCGCIPTPPPLPPLSGSALGSSSSSPANGGGGDGDGGDDGVKTEDLNTALGHFWEMLSNELGLPEPLDADIFAELSSEIDSERKLPFKTSGMFTGDCSVCFETAWLYRRNCCKNPVCQECLGAYFTTLVKDGIVSIHCPCCSEFVYRDEIYYYLKTEDKLKFYRFVINANKDPHRKLCPRCCVLKELPMEVVRDPAIKKHGLQVCCSKCYLEWCFLCEAPWHQGMTCKEYRHGDKLVKAWAHGEVQGTRNAQRCPKCKIFIERISGCDHMTCQHCGAEFCYLCGEIFRSIKFIGNHYKKLSVFGCKYRFKPNQPGQRRLIRGGILGLKLLCLPVITAAAIAAGTAVVGLGTIALPVWGAYKLEKRRRIKKQIKKRRELLEFLNAPCSCSICTTTQVDPYLHKWQQDPCQHMWHQPVPDVDVISTGSSTWTSGEDISSVWSLRKDIQVTAQVNPQIDDTDLVMALDMATETSVGGELKERGLESTRL